MSKEKKQLSRREFIKQTGITGVTSALAISSLSGIVMAQNEKKESNPTSVKVPTRIFGKTKVSVSSLCLGGIFDITANMIVLKKALDWGVSYWDTANGYVGGNSELGIGMYFEKFPNDRKKVFLVTKGGARDPNGLTKMLNLSLERMKTNYIDLYFMHGIRSIDEMTPEIKAWAEAAKKEGKIKFIGFSTHSNMADCLAGAAKLGWVDGLMPAYNYRIMHDDKMIAAVDACQKAGIGITAMKTQGGGQVKTDSEAELKMAGHFIQKGFSPEQAKIKAIWENPAIASICSQMDNLAKLAANVVAANDKTKLEAADFQVLREYAEASNSGYCKGCREICESAVTHAIPIGDVMRYMMYCRSYGDMERARMHFAQLPISVRGKLASLDYSHAESRCPNKLAIGKIMKEASEVLG